MRYRVLFFFTALIFPLLLTGCPSSNPPAIANGANTASSPAANTAPTPATNSPVNTIPKTPEPTANDAPTLGPVYKAYCDAIAKKDEAAVRKLYSQATLKSLEADMKEEGKSLLKYLEDDQSSECSTRNEKIDGDTGVAEVKTKGAPNGFKIKFVKENGEWKLTNEIPDIDSVKKNAANSNAAK